LREIAINLIHAEEFVVGNVGLGKQHVHVSGHAPSNGVNSEFHIDTPLVQCIAEFTHFVLRLCHCHSVSRHDDNFVG
jgi:hypothetical protein